MKAEVVMAFLGVINGYEIVNELNYDLSVDFISAVEEKFGVESTYAFVEFVTEIIYELNGIYLLETGGLNYGVMSDVLVNSVKEAETLESALDCVFVQHDGFDLTGSNDADKELCSSYPVTYRNELTNFFKEKDMTLF